jgi:hypothetical protein
MGKDPRDVAWDLVLQGKGRVMAIYHMMSEPDIRTALNFPWTSIGSDAGPRWWRGSRTDSACRIREAMAPSRA